ncbi:FAD-dependent oxidoreductase [Nakamurella sp. YIM 132087]|uniref:FAD-dependent oxidoreductase n=2 Tax=Nakamurella alba TaxID=2665158 RepID=A0A7K1FLV5_9ACTN|nr:FAD-dependent oxidoreductase [Nakamurella alba]
MTVAHLTGDHSWLEEPYRPTRTVALDDHDTGGLSPERQAEVRAATLEVLRRERDGSLPTPEPPTDQQIVEMLSVAMGETVPAEYGPMLAEESRFRLRDVTWTAEPPTARLADFKVLVVGAGVSGICTAIKLKALGIPFTVVEKNDDIGGTWLENDYPGSGVDTPSHLYSFSFEPSPTWSRYYAKQPEILAYLLRIVDKYDLRSSIEFGVEVESAEYDPASSSWRVGLKRAGGAVSVENPNVLITSVGQLNRAQFPSTPGLADFAGPMFHSAQWQHDVDLAGKRVAVLGTGASAMQIVPTLAGTPAELTVFQRSPQWAAPVKNYRRDISAGKQVLLEHVPYYATWYRIRLLWMFNDKLHESLQVDPAWEFPERSINAANDKHRAFFTEHIRREIAGREDLWDKVLPTYPPYGKRILMDNGWYEAIQRDDVELVTTAVDHVEPDAVVTADGQRHEADVLVLATGFQSKRVLYPMDIRGASGTSIRELWGDEDARAYLGMTVPDFPNLFVVYGPNTNLGHGGSVIFHTECQVNYITRLLVQMLEQGIASIDVRQEVFDRYNADVDAAHEKMIWNHPGVDTWYRNSSGRVVTNTPWRLVDYWAMTRRPDLSDYQVTRLGTTVPAGTGGGARGPVPGAGRP